MVRITPLAGPEKPPPRHSPPGAELSDPAAPTACAGRAVGLFVLPHMESATLALLTALAEPTRLRIVNCLAAAPLFVSELQAILEVPQPTVSRHLRVLRDVGLVRDTPIAQYVLYRLGRPPEPLGRVLAVVLDASQQDPSLEAERSDALARSRLHARLRVETDTEGRPA